MCCGVQGEQDNSTLKCDSMTAVMDHTVVFKDSQKSSETAKVERLLCHECPTPQGPLQAPLALAEWKLTKPGFPLSKPMSELGALTVPTLVESRQPIRRVFCSPSPPPG